MMYRDIFHFTYTVCKGQTRVTDISIPSYNYHFFVWGAFKILSASYFEIYN
jgi:hypothetical protein